MIYSEEFKRILRGLSNFEEYFQIIQEDSNINLYIKKNIMASYGIPNVNFANWLSKYLFKIAGFNKYRNIEEFIFETICQNFEQINKEGNEIKKIDSYFAKIDLDEGLPMGKINIFDIDYGDSEINIGVQISRYQVSLDYQTVYLEFSRTNTDYRVTSYREKTKGKRSKINPNSKVDIHGRLYNYDTIKNFLLFIIFDENTINKLSSYKQLSV